MLIGNIEIATPRRVEGWAQDDARPDSSVTLVITSNDLEVGSIEADLYRQDLERAGIGVGRHAFSFELPAANVSSEPQIIRIFQKSDRAELPGSPITLGSLEQSAAHLLIGSIDSVDLYRMTGWARDQLHPESPVSLLLTINDLFIGRMLANGYRPDLKEAGIGSGRYAFEFEFPFPLAAHESHMVRLVREGDGLELPGSPVTLKASRSFDGDVEKSLALAIAQSGSTQDLPRKIDFLVGQIDKLLQQNADAESLRPDRERYRRLSQRWSFRIPLGVASTPTKPSPAALLRALIIDERLPKLDRDGGSNAIFSHIRSLQRLGYQVTIAPAVDFDPSATERAAIEAAGVTCCCSPYYGSVEEVMRRQAGEFDLIYLHRVSNASKYGELAVSHFPKARRIYSVADLHHLRLLRQAKKEDRPGLVALANRLRLAELTASAFSSAVITHSSYETQLLRTRVKNKSIFTVPWSVKPQPTKVPFLERNGVAFIGSYGHAPNLDAARWLIGDIMPKVRSRDSSIQCFLVGSEMPDEIRRLVTDGIVPIGHVANLAEIFDRVRLTVAPLAYGAGLKGKVLESLSASIPCVCTNIAAEGFEFPAVLRSYVADDSEEIAVSIVRLHGDSQENQRCSRLGLEFVAAEFSEAKIDALMREAVGLAE